MIDERTLTRSFLDGDVKWLVAVGDVPKMTVWGKSAEDALAKYRSGVEDVPGLRALRTAWRSAPALVGMGAVERLGGVIVDDACVEVCGLRYYFADTGRPQPGSTKASPMEPSEPDAEVVDEALLLDLCERSGKTFDVVERGTQRLLRFLGARIKTDGTPADADADMAHPRAHVIARGKAGGIVKLAPKPAGPKRTPDLRRMPGAETPKA